MHHEHWFIYYIMWFTMDESNNITKSIISSCLSKFKYEILVDNQRNTKLSNGILFIQQQLKYFVQGPYPHVLILG